MERETLISLLSAEIQKFGTWETIATRRATSIVDNMPQGMIEENTVLSLFLERLGTAILETSKSILS